MSKVGTQPARPVTFVGEVPRRPLTFIGEVPDLAKATAPPAKIKPWEKTDQPFDFDELCRKLNRYKSLQETEEQLARIRRIEKERKRREAKKEMARKEKAQKEAAKAQCTDGPERSRTALEKRPQKSPTDEVDPQKKAPYHHVPRHAAKQFESTTTATPLAAEDVHPLSKVVYDRLANRAPGPVVENEDDRHLDIPSSSKFRKEQSPWSTPAAKDGGISPNKDTEKGEAPSRTPGEGISRNATPPPPPHGPNDRPDWAQNEEKATKASRPKHQPIIINMHSSSEEDVGPLSPVSPGRLGRRTRLRAIFSRANLQQVPPL